MGYQNIIVSCEQQIGIVVLNRPKVLNALNAEMMSELVDALEHSVGAIHAASGRARAVSRVCVELSR